MIRVDGEWKVVTWEEAISFIAACKMVVCTSKFDFLAKISGRDSIAALKSCNYIKGKRQNNQDVTLTLVLLISAAAAAAAAIGLERISCSR